MKLAYQVATPDVKPSPGVTAYQGNIDTSFRCVKECGYDGVELMVCDPVKNDAEQIQLLCKKYSLSVSMVCTGEVFGQDGVCFSHLDDNVREEALRRAKDAVDLAQKLHAQINIGRIRGGYTFQQPPEICRKRSVDGLRAIAQYAQSKNVIVALEPVNSIAFNFINTTQQGIDMINEICCPALKLMLDTNHMYIDDKDMIASVYDAKEYVSYVHLADSNRLCPGNCKLDFKKFIDTLKTIGYTGWLSIEVFQRPDQDTVLKMSYSYVKPLLSSSGCNSIMD